MDGKFLENNFPQQIRTLSVKMFICLTLYIWIIAMIMLILQYVNESRFITRGGNKNPYIVLSVLDS